MRSVLRPHTFIILLLTYSVNTLALELFESETWTFDADTTAEFRGFPSNDKLDRTEDYTLDLSGHFKANYEGENLLYKLNVLGRYGVFDNGRNILFQKEHFIALPFETFTLKAGYEIYAWNIMEGFTVSDIINSKNLDGDYDNVEKFGELSISYEYLGESTTFGVYYFPRYTNPFWPESSSRMSPVTQNQAINRSDIASSVWVEGDNIVGDSWGHQGAIKLSQTIEEIDMDLDLYSVHHMDRSQPFLTISTDLKLRGHHFKVTQTGVNISKVYESWAFKLEAAFRDFADDTFQPIVGGETLKPDDHAVAAVGLENNITLIEGISSTFFLEYQTLQGIDFNRVEQYSIFQNDLFIGLRSDFNDVAGQQLTLAAFVDLEKMTEFALNASYSRRITNDWKITLGGRVVEAKKSTTPKGLELFRNSDHVYANLTTYF